MALYELFLKFTYIIYYIYIYKIYMCIFRVSVWQVGFVKLVYWAQENEKTCYMV